MVVGNASSNCNGSSAFCFREAVCTIKVIIWKVEPLMGFEMCLRAEPRLYVSSAPVY
jgi:hypothetical protein